MFYLADGIQFIFPGNLSLPECLVLRDCRLMVISCVDKVGWGISGESWSIFGTLVMVVIVTGLRMSDCSKIKYLLN